MYFSVTLGEYHSSNRPMMERGNLSQESEVENIQSNLKRTHSAAGIVCQLKTCHSTQGFQFPLMKDMLGIVATLGKVDDDNISRFTPFIFICKPCILYLVFNQVLWVPSFSDFPGN